MNLVSFLEHHGLATNPFDAEEARHDPIFERLLDSRATHPDFGKILGRIDQPSTAVVLGEKGSGKTAIRLMIAHQVAKHNREHPDRRTYLVAYDDLNPVLDRVVRRHRGAKGDEPTSDHAAKYLEEFRLEDHQDAILGRIVTRLVSTVLGDTREEGEPVLLPDDWASRIKSAPRRQRVSAAVLAALYDQPRRGGTVERWQRFKRKMRLGWNPLLKLWPAAAVLLTIAAVGLAGYGAIFKGEGSIEIVFGGMCLAVALVLWALLGLRHLRLWSLCRRIWKETPAVDRSPGELRTKLLELGSSDLANQPWPTPTVERRNARYQLTAQLVDLLDLFDYTGVMILVDRVDEPTLISGQPDRMKSVIWPMFDNKFLQQDRVGLKLLLPIELRHLLYRESREFFEEARLDKQNLIDRLTWSGAVLYDLCSARLRICQGMSDGSAAESAEGDRKLELTDLFAEEVTRDVLVDALDSMHQPRDAFKFLYAVVQEHCRMVPDDQASYRIPRAVLETTRRSQSQRLQDRYQGLTPA